MRTCEARLSVQEGPLEECADIFNKAQHTMYSEVRKGIDPNKLRHYLKKFDITSRQFTSIRIGLEQKTRAGLAGDKLHLLSLGTRIKKLKKTLSKLKSKKDLKRKIRIHQKSRKLQNLLHKQEALEVKVKNQTTDICFGSRKLFKAQYYLEENGFKNHQEWLEAWQSSRNNQFFVLGSKDEASGNQSCIATITGPNSYNLRLRLPNALLPKYGKYLNISLKLTYGNDLILNALNSKQAISYRFLKDEKGWRVFFLTEEFKPETKTSLNNGTNGIDINVNHLALTETDKNGNPINYWKIPLCAYGKSKEQAKAIIGDAVKSLIEKIKDNKNPLILEDLDFSQKKAQLEDKSKKYKRMLSSFSYSQIKSTIKARAQDQGIEVKLVNPAYTSIIGKHKFSKRYGISSHQAAALVIARRGRRLSERPNSDQGTSAPPGSPCSNAGAWDRAKHVWKYWSKVSGVVAREARVESALGRSSKVSKGLGSPGGALVRPVLASVGEIPTHELLKLFE